MMFKIIENKKDTFHKPYIVLYLLCIQLSGTLSQFVSKI